MINAIQCNRSVTAWFCYKEKLLFLFVKGVLEKKQTSTGSQLCMEEKNQQTYSFNYNQKAVSGYLLQRFFLLT